MSENSTPETDAGICHDRDGLSWVRPSLARKIERERNEAVKRERILQERVRVLESLIGYDPIESGR